MYRNIKRWIFSSLIDQKVRLYIHFVRSWTMKNYNWNGSWFAQFHVWLQRTLIFSHFLRMYNQTFTKVYIDPIYNLSDKEISIFESHWGYMDAFRNPILLYSSCAKVKALLLPHSVRSICLFRHKIIKMRAHRID